MQRFGVLQQIRVRFSALFIHPHASTHLSICLNQAEAMPADASIELYDKNCLNVQQKREICPLFAKQATDNMLNIFSKYGNDVKSSKQLTDIIEYQWRF